MRHEEKVEEPRLKEEEKDKAASSSEVSVSQGRLKFCSGVV